MDSIVYRKLRKKDWKEVEGLIYECFSIHRYSNNPKIIKIILHTYLQSCLSQHTYAYVAENNGVIIGFIIGNVVNAYKTLSHLLPISSTIWNYTNLKIQSKHKSCSLDYYNSMYHVYNEILSEHNDDFDGELILFAVSNDYQGFGIGKKLLQGLTKHWQNHNARKIFLVTDSSCNFGFYNSHGYIRISERTLPITWAKEKTILNVYLYSFDP